MVCPTDKSLSMNDLLLMVSKQKMKAFNWRRAKLLLRIFFRDARIIFKSYVLKYYNILCNNGAKNCNEI